MSGQEPGGRFDPSRYVRQLRGRGGAADYLDIKWRLVWLRSEHPDAQITTEHVTITNDLAIFRAVVSIPGGGSASGYGSETARDFGDFIEKAETKALGRALAALGYGTQFAQDFDEDASAAAVPAEGHADVLRARPIPPRPEPAPAPAATRPPAFTPRPEPIPADARRPVPVRPLREVAPEARPPEAAPARPPATLADEPALPAAEAREVNGVDEVIEAPARPPERRLPRPTATGRLSPPQPAPRPTPRPAAPTNGAGADDATAGDDLDMANYGWTEFWSWARSHGFSDRNALDAAVGRPTKGMTPLEIRKHIQARLDEDR
ncbi:MAG TPA: hypothetical protein VFL91_03570 [Thermomicrobiales bacterium]|nr:hypothetical protein [Thermomicrobiales bacterium]